MVTKLKASKTSNSISHLPNQSLGLPTLIWTGLICLRDLLHRVALECKSCFQTVLCWGLTPYSYPAMSTKTVVIARQGFQCVLWQKSILLTVTCTVEKVFVNITYAFSQTWKNLIFLLDIEFVIAVNYISSLQNRPTRSSAYISMGENDHTKPCSSSAECSLLVFPPLFSNQ